MLNAECRYAECLGAISNSQTTTPFYRFQWVPMSFGHITSSQATFGRQCIEDLLINQLLAK